MTKPGPAADDSVQLWHRAPGDPFPSCIVMTSISMADAASRQEAIGECFLLAGHHGKVYLNGQRARYAVSGDLEMLRPLVLDRAHHLLTRMYRASLRQCTQAAPQVELQPGLIPLEPSGMAMLCRDEAYLPSLRWIAGKAASPALRRLLSAMLDDQRKN